VTRARTLPPLVLLASLLLGARASAAEATVTLESANAFRIYSPHRVQKSQNRLLLEGDVALPFSGWSAHAEGWLFWDPAAHLVGRDPDFGQEPIDRDQIGGSREAEAELRELYLDGELQAGNSLLRLRIGKQQVVWGQSFGLRVLDIVNAQDFREFILDDFNRARTPVFGVRADASIGSWEIQGIVFPDFEPDVLPDFESEFALEPTLPGLFPALAPFAGPGDDPLLTFVRPRKVRDWTGRATGAGFRVATRFKRLDVAAYYWDRPDPRTTLRRKITPFPGLPGTSVNELEPLHLRVRSIGLSFAAALGDFALWGEGSVTMGRGFASARLAEGNGYVRGTDLEYALGLDWNGWRHLFANLQVIELGVLDGGAGIEVDRWRTFVSLLLRSDLRRETVALQLFALAGVDRGEVMLRPSVEWKLTDRLSLSGGVDWFAGPRRGLLGQYAHDRKCVPVPSPIPAPDPSGCHWEPQPGRPSRVFLTVRYAFSVP
jgi:hypothetical protein